MRSEWYKLRKSWVIWLLFIPPLIGLFLGQISMGDIGEANQWIIKLVMANATYALLFLPLITGVVAGFICRYEHQEGGWKQLLALPVTRGKVYLTKYILVLFLVLTMQLLYLGSMLILGAIQGITDPFPWEIVWRSILGGWVATSPLVALQLWMSMIFKNFAAPFSINVIFTLPSLLVINSERFGPYYPWGQPFLMMNIGGEGDNFFFIPWEQLLMVVGGSFIVFFFGGYLYFQRKAV